MRGFELCGVSFWFETVARFDSFLEHVISNSSLGLLLCIHGIIVLSHTLIALQVECVTWTANILLANVTVNVPYFKCWLYSLLVYSFNSIQFKFISVLKAYKNSIILITTEGWPPKSIYKCHVLVCHDTFYFIFSSSNKVFSNDRVNETIQIDEGIAAGCLFLQQQDVTQYTKRQIALTLVVVNRV